MPQTDYSIYQPLGVEGQIRTANSYPKIRGTDGEFVNGESSRLPFGRVVVANSSDHTKVELPSADGQTPLGVTVVMDCYEKDENGNAGVPPNRPVSFLSFGTGATVIMIAEEAVTPSDTPHFRFDAQTTPGAHDAVGRVRTDVNNDGSDHADPSPSGTQFMNSAAAGEPVAVYLG